MHCPTCQTASLAVFRDLQGTDGGRCMTCRGLWCGIDQAITLGVFADARVRSRAVAIAHCPGCEQQTLAPVDTICTVPVRPLRCAVCGLVWIAGATLAALRGEGRATDRAAAPPSASPWAPHRRGLLHQLQALYGADHDVAAHGADDPERQPYVLALAVPVVLLLVWLIDSLGIFRFFRHVTFGMFFHEMGHAVAAWLTGRMAVPLPFITLPAEHSSFVGYLLSTFVLGSMLWYGLRRRLLFWLGLGLVGGFVLLNKGLFSSEPSQSNWIAYSGVGGEFVLGTLCVIAFFHQLHRGASWDLLRYPVLVAGCVALLPAWSTWQRINAGTEPFPLGSMLMGSDHGDMNSLIAAGLGKQAIIDSYLGLGRWCLAVVLVYWLGMAWRAYTQVRKGHFKSRRSAR